MKVRYTRTILRQIDAAMAYLTTQNPQAARGFQTRLLAVVAQLQTHPYSGRETSRRDIRRFPLGTHLYPLRYLGDKHEIVLHRIRHTF